MTKIFLELVPLSELDAVVEAADIADTTVNLSSETEGDEDDHYFYPLDLTIFNPGVEGVLETMRAEPEFSSYESYLADFTDFLSDLNLRFFSPKEFLYLGGSHHAGGACHGLNRLPPRSKWPAVRTLAPVLDEIRARLGSPVTFNSVYRNNAYNSCIGGVSGSFHKQFNAVDFRCSDGHGSGHWAAVANTLRNEGTFKGGIGIYNSFVHVDTRGVNANWDKRG